MWQLGKGNVTNGNAAVEDLIDPNISRVIQHSANVDSGNSGGPLLIQNSGKGFKYVVAGVNTWKARYRDGTNFSIPASAVKKFVDNAIKNPVPDSEKKDSVVKNIAKALDKGVEDYNFTYLQKYVSYELALKTSSKSFIDVMKYGTSNVRSAVSEIFQSDPIEGMKAVAAYKILAKYHDEETKNSSEFASKLQLIIESGVFRITGECEEMEEPVKNTKKSNGKSSSTTAKKGSGISFGGLAEEDSSISIAFGLNKLLSGSAKSEFEDDFKDCDTGDGFFGEVRFTDTIFSVGVGFEKSQFKGTDYIYGVGGGALGLPLDFNIAIIKPFVKGCMGMNMDIFKIGYEAGCEIYIGNPEWNVRPGFGVAYGGAWFSQEFDEYTDNTLKIYGIIGF